mmetsp:Transcript_107453/g.302360  ORF Transcript_107453/g.302360 Transcript_107453/m.302360 type:complete len:423 (-) Transcript_107453:1317-2585(-)
MVCEPRPRVRLGHVPDLLAVGLADDELPLRNVVGGLHADLARLERIIQRRVAGRDQLATWVGVEAELLVVLEALHVDVPPRGDAGVGVLLLDVEDVLDALLRAGAAARNDSEHELLPAGDVPLSLIGKVLEEHLVGLRPRHGRLAEHLPGAVSPPPRVAGVGPIEPLHHHPHGLHEAQQLVGLQHGVAGAPGPVCSREGGLQPCGDFLRDVRGRQDLIAVWQPHARGRLEDLRQLGAAFSQGAKAKVAPVQRKHIQNHHHPRLIRRLWVLDPISHEDRVQYAVALHVQAARQQRIHLARHGLLVRRPLDPLREGLHGGAARAPVDLHALTDVQPLHEKIDPPGTLDGGLNVLQSLATHRQHLYAAGRRDRRDELLWRRSPQQAGRQLLDAPAVLSEGPHNRILHRHDVLRALLGARRRRRPC